MIQRIKCFLSNCFKVDMHKWEVVKVENSEYEPDLAYITEKCRKCSKIRFSVWNKEYFKKWTKR